MSDFGIALFVKALPQTFLKPQPGPLQGRGS